MQKIFVLTILLLLIGVTNVQASFTEEAGMISYQISDSDRIIVGEVTNIQKYPEYSVVTIKVDEWLMGSFPTDEIDVITEVGYWKINNNEPRFYTGESVVLMLQDINVSENRFKVTIGEPGKHPVTDRDEIISELGSVTESERNEMSFIATYGSVRHFDTKDEQYNWFAELDNVTTHVDVDMQQYMYPNGPILFYGHGYDGYILVTFMEGSEFDKSSMDEIYEIIDKIAVENGIDDIPVKFDSVEVATEDVPGFTIIPVILVLFIIFRKQR